MNEVARFRTGRLNVYCLLAHGIAVIVVVAHEDDVAALRRPIGPRVILVAQVEITGGRGSGRAGTTPHSRPEAACSARSFSPAGQADAGVASVESSAPTRGPRIDPGEDVRGADHPRRQDHITSVGQG